MIRNIVLTLVKKKHVGIEKNSDAWSQANDFLGHGWGTVVLMLTTCSYKSSNSPTSSRPCTLVSIRLMHHWRHPTASQTFRELSIRYESYQEWVLESTKCAKSTSVTMQIGSLLKIVVARPFNMSLVFFQFTILIQYFMTTHRRT